MNLDAITAQLVDHEGLRLKPYTDTVGKLTIGVGRNLDDKGISEAEARVLLANDIQEVIAGLDKWLPWWRGLDEIRQRVLIDMTFNLGLVGFLGFKNTLAAIERGDYKSAAAGMRASKWAKQVGRRAEVLSRMMEEGTV